MAFYEFVYLARQDVQSAQVDAISEQLKKALEDNGATVAKTEYWGLKTLAYRIKKNRKAHYVLVEIDGPHAAVAEAERFARLNEDIIRFMTVRVDELQEGPSIMMQPKSDRRGRDDRDRRGRDDREQRGRNDRDREAHRG